MEDQIEKPNIKILVVDDREDNLFSIETILEKDDYTLVKANSGRAALKILLTQHDFTLILMDVQMPGMNGIETATLISEREKLKHIPIIFITAHNYEEEFIFQGYEMGGVDYIYKPINPELLRVKVGVFVELYRKNHELVMQEKKLLSSNKKLEIEIGERKINEQKIKLLNLQLVENNSLLKTINQDLDRFAYVASHDLQEPLRKILLFSDRIMTNMENYTDPSLQLYLKKITTATQRMQQLVNDLLKFSRHTHDILDLEKIDLNTLLTEVLSDMETDIQRKNANITFDKLPTLFAIPSQIRQLFQNLISNSIKFAKPNVSPVININSELVNGASITGVDKKHSNALYYNISVRDNGIGFDRKFADDIFVVFKRLHSYHEFEGTGIGLSICKKIVEKHNGFITAESEVDQGSMFTVSLPAKVELKSEFETIEQVGAN